MKIGIAKLIEDLLLLGFKDVSQLDAGGTSYAVIPKFIIPAGSSADRIISLGVPAPADYPRNVAASMHVKADPHLFPFGNVPGIRNVVASPLGDEWQYWSYTFQIRVDNPTLELITQINEVFRKN